MNQLQTAVTRALEILSELQEKAPNFTPYKDIRHELEVIACSSSEVPAMPLQMGFIAARQLEPACNARVQEFVELIYSILDCLKALQNKQ